MPAPTRADGHSLPVALPVKMTDCSSGRSCCRHNPKINHPRQYSTCSKSPCAPFIYNRSFQFLLRIRGTHFSKEATSKICRPHSSFQKQLIVMAQQICPFSSGRREELINLVVNWNLTYVMVSMLPRLELQTLYLKMLYLELLLMLMAWRLSARQRGKLFWHLRVLIIS